MKDISKKYVPIGQVVDQLNKDYPSLSISKVRYLEDEGLLEPKRTKGGYRQFSSDDILRLEEILKLQKDYFLPLQIIKDKMSDWDAKKSASKFRLEMESEEVSAKEEKNKTFTIEEAAKAAKVSADQIKGLETYGLLNPDKSENEKIYYQSDIAVMKVFYELSKYGIEPRHLRIYENLASKEAMLFQQILSPKLKNKSRASKTKIKKDASNLSDLAERLQRLLRSNAIDNSKIS